MGRMCCSDKRNVWVTSSRSSRAGGRPAGGMLYLEYTGQVSLELTGAVTGRKYHFIPGEAVQPVDGRDVRSLLSIPGVRMAEGARL